MVRRSALKPAAPHRYTEYNVAQLGLISVQSKLPAGARTGWTSETREGKNTAGTRSSTAHASGVPHGIAGDVFSALVTETIAARENGETQLQMTVADIARQAGLGTRAADYERITVALQQLRHTNYEIWHKWRTTLTHVKEEAVLTLLPTLITRTEESLDFPGQQNRLFVMELHPSVMGSITGALTLATDPLLLEQLTSPTARGIYRLLEAWRRDPQDLTRVGMRVTIRGVELVESARLMGSRSSVSQLLAPLLAEKGAFAQLRDAGYLRRVDWTGRGDNLTLAFEFAQKQNLMDMRALQLLNELGVTGTHAETLAMTFNRELVESAAWQLEERRKAKYPIKSGPGMLIKILKDGSAAQRLEEFRARKRPLVMGGEAAGRPPSRRASSRGGALAAGAYGARGEDARHPDDHQAPHLGAGRKDSGRPGSGHTRPGTGDAPDDAGRGKSQALVCRPGGGERRVQSGQALISVAFFLYLPSGKV